jgi:hypothetical protein
MVEEQAVLKVGTTITYQCQLPKKVQHEPMEVEYGDDCTVCTTNSRNIVLLPCRHNVLCEYCASQRTECPLCEGDIAERIRIFN